MEREYHPSLINQLKNDHQKILDFYSQTYNLFVKNDSHEHIKEKLSELKAMLVLHLNFEDSILYPYLESIYEEETLKFIKDADNKMKIIAKDALKFIMKCSDSNEYNRHHKLFIEELKSLGDILIERIEFEENRIYTLYEESVGF